MITAVRSHEFSYGHRVVGHESKCRHLHGHNAQVSFLVQSISGKLDDLGRVVDFSVVKSTLCQWLEDNWDHRMLLWTEDTIIPVLDNNKLSDGMDVVGVPFNPTAENMSLYLLEVIGPKLLTRLGLRLVGVEFFETSKCSVQVQLDDV